MVHHIAIPLQLVHTIRTLFIGAYVYNGSGGHMVVFRDILDIFVDFFYEVLDTTAIYRIVETISATQRRS